MQRARPLILLAFHWYLESLHRGVMRRCLDAGYEARLLNFDSIKDLNRKPHAGIVGRFPPDPSHPVRRFIGNSVAPVVELSLDYAENHDWRRFPEDSERIGRIAADYLRQSDVRSFVFVSGEGASHEIRWRSFKRALLGDPRPCLRFRADGWDYPAAVPRLAALLSRTRRPAGVFGSSDAWASVAVEAGILQGLSVPEDLKVLGFGNREFESTLTCNPISSIDIDHECWAYSATGLLLEAIRGEAPPGTVRFFAPGNVIERASTVNQGSSEVLSSRAMMLVRSNPARFSNVKALSEEMAVSKAVLERAFSQSFNAGVAQKLLEVRLDLAKCMLASGEKVERVAAEVGFSTYRGFSKAFRRRMGCSPSDCRGIRNEDPGRV